MKTLCTVIVPHFNQISQLDQCLSALEEQTFDKNDFEVLVIDNGTEDIESYFQRLSPHYKMNLSWFSNTVGRNPYISRNLGIQKSEGNVIAFLDAACVPHHDWLKNAYSLIKANIDIVAGRFELTYPTERLRDRVHGLLYLNNKKNVKRAYGVPCGNLIVKKNLFDNIGVFNEDHISGQDIVWTRRALASGYAITYSADCTVQYRAFGYNELLQKMIKYSKGVQHHKRNGARNISTSGIRGWLPMRLSNFQEALRYRELDTINVLKKIYLWMLVWKAKIVFSRSQF